MRARCERERYVEHALFCCDVFFDCTHTHTHGLPSRGCDVFTCLDHGAGGCVGSRQGTPSCATTSPSCGALLIHANAPNHEMTCALKNGTIGGLQGCRAAGSLFA